MVFLRRLGEPGDSFFEIRLYATAHLVECAHHGHGAGIAIIGKGFGNLAGGFEFLVLEQGDGFFKAWLPPKPGAPSGEQEKK